MDRKNMDRLFTSFVILAVSITLKPIPITALQGAEQPKNVKQNQISRPPIPTNRENEKDQRNKENQARHGDTANRPVVIEGTVKVINQTNSQEEAKSAQQAKSVKDKAWDVLTNPEQWPNIAIAFLAAIGTAFAIGAYRASKRQALAAENQLALAKDEFKLATCPRLYVDGVRAINFERGTQPTYCVRIVNAGPAVAQQVTVKIIIEVVPVEAGARFEGGENVIMIPANDSRECFVESPYAINLSLFQGLRVSGYFRHDGTTTKYCYKYYLYGAINVPRPEDLPQFVPCDFDSTRTVSIGGISRGSSTATGSLTGGITPSEST